MRRNLGGLLAVLAALAVGGTALAHDLDHPAPSFSEPAPLSSAVNAGGEDAEWELVATIPTGNPQTDLDFFTSKGITYMSVGSLATGPNSAGQNIVQLTDEKGEVAPAYVTGHPSATCPKATRSATGLQHDPEASPKGSALLQQPNPYAVTTDAQVVVDATDATGRCHDQGALGVAAAPQGGLEIIDVTDPAKPVEIGLTSHVGEAHTVNVDPKRPHIAYVSASDRVFLNEEGVRQNEAESTSSFDGIEVVDMSSCMNFPPGTEVGVKRDLCRPVVYRYRWPDVNVARSHTYRDSTAACHELEIYPDDRLVCAGVMATPVLNMKGAFDDNGTPTDFTDDKPRGTPLPCSLRDSSTEGDLWDTGAKVTDCVNGVVNGEPVAASLRVKPWLEELGAPSLAGVERLGTYHHMGFFDQIGDNATPEYESSEDIFVSHEAELTQSGNFVLVTDERGGGVLPVGSSCSPGEDNTFGNGGIHAFRIEGLGEDFPAEDAVEAYQQRVYATDSKGKRAIHRAPIHTKPQGTICTSHVFQQIPGQNRIFMGWYSQGTQVVDFVENADGTIDFETAAYFIPENANTWTSHVFKVQENKDGTFTYWGATGDFNAGEAGRNAIDIYKVTLPPPPKPRTASGEPPAGTPTFPVSETKGEENEAAPPACASASGFDDVGVKPVRKRKRLRFSFSRRSEHPVKIQVMRKSVGRKVIGPRVARFKKRTKPFTWKARGTGNGYYQIRYTTRAPNGKKDVRHLGVRKQRGRFRKIGPFDRRESCALVKYFRVRSPVFGGKDRRPLPVVVRLNQPAKVSVVVTRKGKVVKRTKPRNYRAHEKRSIVLRFGNKAKRGLYVIKLKAERRGRASELTLFSRYL